jgi:hypothetical protein
VSAIDNLSNDGLTPSGAQGEIEFRCVRKRRSGAIGPIIVVGPCLRLDGFVDGADETT